MKKIVIVTAMLAFSGIAQAKPAFTGPNYTGLYECKGENSSIGAYEVDVALRLNRVSSHGKFGAYYYETETVNSTLYHGQAVAVGNHLAISFNIRDKKNNVDHSTGLATIKKISKDRWSFRKEYFEPDDSGGNYGTEDCVMKVLTPEEKKALEEKNLEKTPPKPASVPPRTKQQ
ncbi:hypothetical protein LG201_03475 [Methylobacillus gramineus]|uniref:hypothetical protein n=1 Tax=Methylobacillus gramineus TaxID=755169 RepID=UPI001CFFC709|nr:hypothetical protein [Methylobacillus gramineus]MCB5184259.1 hypothetical protein [Methylobacillus gramineus]